MPLNKKKAGVIALTTAGCLAAAGAVAVAAPALKDSALMPDAVSEHVFKEKTKAFVTAADAPGQGDNPAFVLPSWVPKDARSVKVKVKTDGDAKLIRFTLPGGERLRESGDGAGDGCGAAVGAAAGAGTAAGDGAAGAGTSTSAGTSAGTGTSAVRVGDPVLDAPWWPDRTPSKSRVECGDAHRYRVAVDGNTVYAWTNGDPSPVRGTR